MVRRRLGIRADASPRLHASMIIGSAIFGFLAHIFTAVSLGPRDMFAGGSSPISLFSGALAGLVIAVIASAVLKLGQARLSRPGCAVALSAAVAAIAMALIYQFIWASFWSAGPPGWAPPIAGAVGATILLVSVLRLGDLLSDPHEQHGK
jgi:hypothetical protein